MQNLLFAGACLLGSEIPEATPKFYPLHPKIRIGILIKYDQNSVINSIEFKFHRDRSTSLP